MIEAGASGNITLSAAGVNNVNTIFQNALLGPATIDMGGYTLRLGTDIGLGNISQTNAVIGAFTFQNGNLTAGGSDNTAGTLNINNSSTSQGIVISGAVTDNGLGVILLIKGGAGALTLSGANSHTGGTALNAGTLVLGNAAALGTGTLTINTGTIDSSVNGLVLNNNLQVWNGDLAFAGTQSLDMGTGTISLGTASGSGRTLTVVANNLTLGGIITNGVTAASLTKAGAGTLTLTGANAHTRG